MIEKLYCENGQHSWERESKRGKKPKNCPDHMPTPAPKSATALYTSDKGLIRLLRCKHDGHIWHAPIQRGRPPKFCPEHDPKKLCAEQHKKALDKHQSRIIHATEADGPGEIFLREVYCHEGNHTWLAPVKRGKPPRNCPEHAVKGAIERKGELDQQKKEKAQIELQESIEYHATRVQAAEVVDRGTMAKLIEAGGADGADEETFKQWLRANSVLLHEVEALRNRERRLMEL